MDSVQKDHTERTPSAVPRRRAARWAFWIVLTLIGLFVAAELVARFYLGLGDPPLSIADPDIEYLFKPSQDVRRFGNRIYYNAYSMRSEDFPRQKTDPRELRVMVIGDSIVNGGAQTDQSELATTILQKQLQTRLNRQVIVGNISAGSWGPVNMLAYAKKYGLFDADVVVIVLSSGDVGDVPTEPFTPAVGIVPELPDRKPILAVGELMTRYIVPRLRSPKADATMPGDAPPKQTDIDRSLSGLRGLIEMAQSVGAKVIVAQYLEKKEIGAARLAGHEMIRQAAADAGATVVQLADAQEASVRAGRDPFRDGLHPNAVGQQVLADALLEPILSSQSVDTSGTKR